MACIRMRHTTRRRRVFPCTKEQKSSMNRSVYDNGALRGDCNGTDASLIGRTGSAHPGSVKSLSNLVSSLALDWARPDSASGLWSPALEWAGPDHPGFRWPSIGPDLTRRQGFGCQPSNGLGRIVRAFRWPLWGQAMVHGLFEIRGNFKGECRL